MNFPISSSWELSLLPCLCNLFKGEADWLWALAFLNVQRPVSEESLLLKAQHICAIICVQDEQNPYRWLGVSTKWDKVHVLVLSLPPLVGPTWLDTSLCGGKVQKTNDAKINNKWCVMLLATQPHLYVRPSNDKVQRPVLMGICFDC